MGQVQARSRGQKKVQTTQTEPLYTLPQAAQTTTYAKHGTRGGQVSHRHRHWQKWGSGRPLAYLVQRILRRWVEFAYLKTAVRGRKLGRSFLEEETEGS